MRAAGRPSPELSGPSSPGPGRPQAFLLLVAFWIGFNFRAPLLGVPPVLSSVQRGLHLDYAEAGLITAVPILFFGLAAFPGAALVRRRGGYAIVAAGLGLATVGELIRALPGGGAWAVFLGTAAMGGGIAVAQPGLPALLQHWFSHNIQRGSVTVTLGITVGELVASSITQSVLRGWLHGWQGTMAFWGLMSATALLLWLVGVPRARVGLAADTDWDLAGLLLSPRLWAVYLMFAGQSLVFFASNTWIPTSVPGGPHSAMATICLATLNGVMVPVDVLLILLGRPFATRRWFYLISAAITLAGALGWLLGSSVAPILFAALIGTGVALNFAGLMAYPPLVAAPSQVAALTAAMLTVGYLCAFLGPILGGVALDAGGGRQSPFIPIALAALGILVAAPWAPFGSQAPEALEVRRRARGQH